MPHNKTPEGPTRTCIKCEKDKPIGEFLQRTDSNSRRTECDTCRLAISRSRYLTVDERQRLTLILEQGDSIIGLPCPKCQRAFAAGDAVETVSLEGLIHHHDCGIETPTGDSQ